jgi:hypothetical protein
MTEIKMETTDYKACNTGTKETHERKYGKECLRKMQRPSHYTNSVTLETSQPCCVNASENLLIKQ